MRRSLIPVIPDRAFVRGALAPRLVARVPGTTATQERAVREVMRLFADDDMARGVSDAEPAWCDRCAAPRSACGAIRYDRTALCNTCATAFELARLRGTAHTAAQFLEVQQRRLSA